MTLTLIVVVLLAVAILPSALNIPQSNPNTVPEYAPVPPDEESQTEEQGNLAALGQAQGSGLARAGGQPLVVPSPASRRTSGKRCVGNPPRQTEDPMSPPCVAFFEGDNGGATWRGVTRNEITAVIYWDGDAQLNVGDGIEAAPLSPQYCDIDLPPNTGGPGCYVRDTNRDHTYVRWARAFSNFFNQRYQTYNRRVHLWGYWGPATGASAERKRSIASEHFEKLNPFAAFDQSVFTGNDDAYLDALARRGVMIFRGPQTGAPDYQPAAFFRRYAPQVWDFAPDLEHWAEHYVSYVCTKIAGNPVAHTVGTFTDGRPMRGSPRKYAFMATSSAAFPGTQQFAKVVKAELRSRCGVDGMEVYTPVNSPFGILLSAEASQAAADNVARMKQENVTTVLWLGGGDWNTTEAADKANYYPEVLNAGDGDTERNVTPRVNRNRNWVRNSWVVTFMTRFDSLETDPRYLSCKEADPSLTKGSCSFAAGFQRDYFMLFGAVQAAGARLSPRAVDRGFHALPAIRSSSPFVASCFFDPGDYSCVKDAMHQWYDPDARAPDSNQAGCYKMIKEGKRFLASQWDPGDDVFPNTTDRCNAYSGGGVFEPS